MNHSFLYKIPDITLPAEGPCICELEKELCQTLSAPFWTFSWIDMTGIAWAMEEWDRPESVELIL